MYDAKVVDDFTRRLTEKVRYLRENETEVARPTRNFAEAVIHELEQSAEELRVTGEELRAQGEQLLSASRAIDQERERFFRLFDLAPDPIVVTDLHGGMLEVNRAAARLLGTDRSMLFRKPLAAFLTPESLRDFRGAILRLGRMESVRDLSLELSPRNGAGVPTAVRAAHLPGQTAEPDRILWTFRDQSDLLSLDAARQDLAREKESREVAEARSEQARYLVRAAAELADGGDPKLVASRAARLAADFGDYATIEVLDHAGRLSLVGAFHPHPEQNAYLLSRLDREIPRERSEDVVRYLESAGAVFVAPGEPWPAQLQLGEGTLPEPLRPVALGVVPLLVQGKVIGLLRVVAASGTGAAQLSAWAPLLEAFASYVSMTLHNARLLGDADGRRSAAEESSRGRTRAMAGLSHELRTPLHSILGYSELMLDGVAGELSKKALEYVSSIRASALHQAELVDDILALSRPSRTPRLSPSDVAIEDLVHDCVAMVVERARANGVRVEVDVPSDLTLVTDRAKLSQVLINLLTNAVKFTAEGEVALTARGEGSRVILEIRDSGCGIPATELPHIFEPFWQGTASERSGGEGAGLGLSLVSRLVGLLGGSVAVHSEERVGSTFRVSLPRVRVKD